MQLVIDIPDGYVGVIMKNQRMEGSVMDKLIRQAIIDGTQLPKGHGKLIDVDVCKKNKRNFCEKSTRTNWYDIIDDLLDDTPTIIKADKGE